MKKIHITCLRIVALFTIAIFISFIPDYLHDFFGDWLCEGAKHGKLIPETDANWSHYELIGCYYAGGIHNPTWHYGYRHWLFLAMGVSIFIIQLIDIISNKFD